MDSVQFSYMAQNVQSGNKAPDTKQPALKQPPIIDAKLKQDITQVKDVFEKFNAQVNKYEATAKAKDENNQNIAVAGLSVIPFYRRFAGVEDAAQSRDLFKATARGLIALINVPEDTSDLIKAKNQIKSKVKGEADLISNDYQTKFSFFRGTLFEPILKKMLNSTNQKIHYIGKCVSEADKTILETRLGSKLMNLLKVEISDVQSTTRKDLYNEAIKAYKFEGKPLARLICRAMARIPVISLGAVAIMETPAIIRSFSVKNDKDTRLSSAGKQIAKSLTSITAITSATALIGALCASKKGHIGSLVGIGLGSVIGSKVAEITNKKIDGLEL